MSHQLAALTCVALVVLAVSFRSASAAPENLALVSHGCRAFSNGDARDGAEKAINGDASAVGGMWVSALNGRISGEDPAVWGVEFPAEELVNKVVVHSHCSAFWQLTDFRLEYANSGGQFRLVEPLDRTWRNPVVTEIRNTATYLFAPVLTKSLRLVITGCGANHVPLPWGKEKASAHLVEFEAYRADLAAERAESRRRKTLMARLRRKAERWEARPFEEDETGTSPNARWLLEEKLRAGYAIGIDHLSKYAKELRVAGLNTIINHYWRGQDPGDDPASPESNIARIHEILAPLGMRQFLWTALYFYPEDLPHPMDRGALYRRTADAFGVKSEHGPCPLDEKMWDRFTRIAQKVDALAAKYPTVQGFQFDWELYAADSGTSCGSFAYNSQQCFCDHCLATFFRKIGATERVEDLPPEVRFSELTAAGLLPKYFAALGEEVYAHGSWLRRILHRANPDLILGWYGTNSVQPFLPLASKDSIFAQQSGYAPTTWFGYALARAFGTSRLPMVFLPNTISDTRPGSPWAWEESGQAWWSGDKSLAEQAKIDAQRELHVLWVDGIIPVPELGAQGLQRALRWTTKRGNGYWINELYRFTAPRENPAWSGGVYRNIIDSFWEALHEGGR